MTEVVEENTRPRVRPGVQESVDAAFLLAMGAVALLALAPTYTGVRFLVVGVVGLLLGMVITHVTTSLRWPLVAPVLLALGVFYLLGPALCLGSAAPPLPTGSAIGLLTDQALFGWKDLLTTLPPVDGDGTLLVLPWLLGLAAGVAGTRLSRISVGSAWVRAVAPVLVPAALLVVVILLGVSHPQSVWLQGAAFAALGLGWLAARASRSSVSVRGGHGRTTRLVTAAVLVGLAAGAAMPLAGATPAAGQRTIWRDRIEPPFDVGQYPSPLASFRRYVDQKAHPDPQNLYTEPLLSITGVPAGTRVRFATLDSYDGTVWGASNNAIPGAGDDTYQRVSGTIDNPVPGRAVSAEVLLEEGYTGVWLPVVGALQTLDFEQGEVAAKQESFRFNRAASTAVVPSGLRPGDRYRFTAVLPDDRVAAEDPAGPGLGAAAEAAAFLAVQADDWAGDETTPMRRVFAVADHLRQEGKYTDGVGQAEKVFRAGHHVQRLGEGFANAPVMAGNDEQYAATMALLANRLGVPARVVMGAVVPENGPVMGSDVQAWVELQVADGTWRTLPTEAFMGTEHPAKQPPRSQREMSGVVVPPPAPVPPPSTLDEQNDVELKAREGRRSDDPAADARLPTWLRVLLVYGGSPLLGVLVVLSGILLAKAWRRRRRRRAARVSARVVGAWRELVDHARDLGEPVPVAATVTRREQSVAMGSAAAPVLARRADAHTFGPSGPRPDQAASYWTDVLAERRAMSGSLPRLRRWRAAVSLASFRRAPRPAGPEPRRRPQRGRSRAN